MNNIRYIYKKLLDVGQEELALHLNPISEEEQNILISEIKNIDFDNLYKIWNDSKITVIDDPEVDYQPIESVSFNEIPKAEYEKIGINIISQNKAAVVIMSGGMGSRLGYNGAKGTFMLTERKSVFNIHIDYVLKISKKSNYFPLVLIMTSALNHEEIIDFFKKNNYFSYPKEKIIFFTQGEIPAFDEKGHILLSSKNKILTTPDGNGGIFKALKKSGLIKKMLEEKIKWLHVVGIDNVLTKPLDPYFLAFSETNNFDISSKSVKRDSYDEKVGLIVKKNSKPTIVEYTELPEVLRFSKNDKGDFIFNNANIASHLFKIEKLYEFLDKDLPFHRAHKILNYFRYGKYYEPDKPNAYKLEQFLFDIFPMFSEMGVYQVDRETEFSPLKNKEGKDSIKTAKESYLKFGAENGYF